MLIIINVDDMSARGHFEGHGDISILFVDDVGERVG
jgi:hypothetical protein